MSASIPISPPETVLMPTRREVVGAPRNPEKRMEVSSSSSQRVDPDDVPAPEEGVERPVVPGDGSGMRCRHPAGQFRASHLERDDGLSRVTGPAARVRYAFGIADGFHEQGDDGGFGVIHKVIHVIASPRAASFPEEMSRENPASRGELPRASSTAPLWAMTPMLPLRKARGRGALYMPTPSVMLA